MPNADGPGATPSPTPPHAGADIWLEFGGVRGVALPTALSMIAGLVDLTGFLSFDGLFTAHITGNLALVAALAVRGGTFHLVQVLVIPMFVVAVAATWGLTRLSGWRGAVLARRFLWIQFVLLAGVAVLSWVKHVSADPHGLMAGIAAMAAVSAIACQFAVFRIAFPGGPSTSTMTGNLTSAVLSLVARMFPPAAGARHEKMSYALHLLAGFLGGCIVAGFAFSTIGDAAWVLPAVLAGAVAVLPWEDRGAGT